MERERKLSYPYYTHINNLTATHTHTHSHTLTATLNSYSHPHRHSHTHINTLNTYSPILTDTLTHSHSHSLSSHTHSHTFTFTHNLNSCTLTLQVLHSMQLLAVLLGRPCSSHWGTSSSVGRYVGNGSHREYKLSISHNKNISSIGRNEVIQHVNVHAATWSVHFVYYCRFNTTALFHDAFPASCESYKP
jgi:hypothetical protein